MRVTRHGLSHVQPLVIRLLPPLSTSAPSMKRRDEDDDTRAPFGCCSCSTTFTPVLIIDDLLVSPLPIFSSEMTGVPTQTIITSCSLTGVPAVIFTASSLKTWLRALLSDLSPLTRRCFFSNRSFTPSINAWSPSFWMKSSGNPRAQWASYSVAATDSCSDSPFSWILAFSWD